MKKWAIAYINFFDNNVVVKVVEVDGNWKDALEVAFPGYAEHVSDDLDEAKSMAFDQEWGFDITEIV